MKLRSVGFALTIAAVLVLLGSALWGLRARPGAGSGMREAMVLAPDAATRQRIRVEVLNGAGISGLARDVTERLRGAGFDVVYYGNAGSLARDSSTILDRAGDPAAIAALSDELDLTRIETAIDTTLYLEATVVLGADWVSEPR